MAKVSVKQRMLKFEAECLENGKEIIANNGYRAIEIERNTFNKIMKNYSDIAETKACTREDERDLTLVFSRKSTATLHFNVRFSSAKKGRPSKKQNTTEIRRLWNGILKASSNANK